MGNHDKDNAFHDEDDTDDLSHTGKQRAQLTESAQGSENIVMPYNPLKDDSLQGKGHYNEKGKHLIGKKRKVVFQDEEILKEEISPSASSVAVTQSSVDCTTYPNITMLHSAQPNQYQSVFRVRISKLWYGHLYGPSHPKAMSFIVIDEEGDEMQGFV